MTPDIRNIVSTVQDPEIPVLTIEDLGILRDIRVEGDAIEIVITPTYSGCPAMDMIAVNIRAALQAHGYEKVKVTTILDPPWTTDWISEDGKAKLRQYGIAPPVGTANKNALLGEEKKVPCPHCGSGDTELISLFGSTACKSLYRCKACLEPFDYFKCH